MTADHFVQPVNNCSISDSAAPKDLMLRQVVPVRAGDLQPGCHSVLVLKVVPIPVHSVQRHMDGDARVSLTVHHSERHAIFVQGPWQFGSGVQTMGVESGNVDGRGLTSLTQQRTFVFPSESNPIASSDIKHHASSAPPSLHVVSSQQVQHEETPVLSPRTAWEQCSTPRTHYAHSNASEEVGNRHQFICPSSRCGSEISIPSNIVNSLNMVVSGSSAVFCGATINGHNGVQDALDVQDVQDLHEEQQIGVSIKAASSDLFQLQNMGLRSVGSLQHMSGECKPCVFENQRQHYQKPPCSKGALCEFCHENHDDIRKSKRQYRRQQRLQDSSV
eukprot:gnl/MRDRNA2_/MRDRNA2_16838_c0_seq1.p1 gnl/MRDRNA2_/MRDRNA2_16838_c0~~gnl/MRDRNA2_/MRDRNA2_16838_c0_seq1.p1  ORF type:complete len:390 (+),score=70.02 gnl/MRDRNA2_/MRDRNA2_16838_c0_seq1:175-1170(+)